VWSDLRMVSGVVTGVGLAVA